MRTRLAWTALVVVGLGLASLTAPALATGVFGGDAPSRIPVAGSSFAATFEDVGGTTVQVTSKATFNGEVFVYGRFGAGQVTVPFEKIAELKVQKADDPLKRIAVITLTDGSDPVRIELEDDTPFYGHTRFGNYKIEVRDLRAVRGFRLLPKE